MSKYVWSWSYDGSTIYVYEIYTTRFTHRHKLNQIKWFSTEAFDKPQLVAEQFIERLERVIDLPKYSPENNNRPSDAPPPPPAEGGQEA